MLTTDQKGAIAESAIVHAALKLGVGFLKPISSGERYDLLLDLRPRLLRVQCKNAVLRHDVLAVPCFSSRRSSAGFVKRPYTLNEIDAIAAYSTDLDRCFLLHLSRFGVRTYV